MYYFLCFIYNKYFCAARITRVWVIDRPGSLLRSRGRPCVSLLLSRPKSPAAPFARFLRRFSPPLEVARDSRKFYASASKMEDFFNFFLYNFQGQPRFNRFFSRLFLFFCIWEISFAKKLVEENSIFEEKFWRKTLDLLTEKLSEILGRTT